MASQTLLPTSQGPRVIVYHQTIYRDGNKYVSLLPLITNQTGVTHVIVAAIHLNNGPGNITLNDDPPDSAKYDPLWGEVAWLQASGVKVLAMLGGAAKGTFERLDGIDQQKVRLLEFFHPRRFRLVRACSSADTIVSDERLKVRRLLQAIARIDKQAQPVGSRSGY
jgi:hypothetical protein